MAKNVLTQVSVLIPRPLERLSDAEAAAAQVACDDAIQQIRQAKVQLRDRRIAIEQEENERRAAARDPHAGPDQVIGMDGGR